MRPTLRESPCSTYHQNDLRNNRERLPENLRRCRQLSKPGPNPKKGGTGLSLADDEEEHGPQSKRRVAGLKEMKGDGCCLVKVKALVVVWSLWLV